MPDRDCLFCRPHDSKILCESPGWYARYDNFPATPGHVEIVPKRHIESWFDLAEDEVTEMHDLTRSARDLLTAEYAPDGWTIGVNEGRAAGRSIDHLHIHLIPRHYGDVPDPRGGIRRGLPNCDPDAWSTPTTLTPGDNSHA